MFWLKSCFLLSLILAILIYQHHLENNRSYERGFKAFYAQSENSREIYTGKIKPVYNPLDKAYVISDQLKKFVATGADKLEHTHWSTLSIWVDPKDLYSEETGIFTNGYKKGRLWERAAYLRYYKGKQKVFESYVGLRLHGKGSRRKRVKQKNLRVYFKKDYGKSSFNAEPTITFREGAPVKRMVIRKETEPVYNWNLTFINDFSSYILHKLGGLGPKFKHVALYINGEFYGYSTITAFLSFDQIKHSLESDDFVFAKLRGETGIRDHVLLDRLRFTLEKYPNLNFDFVNEKIDIDSITAALIRVIYTADVDWSQGMYLKRLGAEQKWRYIAWDFDLGLLKDPRNTDKGTKELHNMHSVKMVIKQKKGTIPWSVFNRLIHSDEKFRDHFSKKIDQLFFILENEETKARLELYEKLAEDSLTDDAFKSLKKLKLFIANRKPKVCRDLKHFVKLEPISCRNPK